jgi:hypothetical protein
VTLASLDDRERAARPGCYSCGLTALPDHTKASQRLKINLDRGLSEGV